MNAARPLWSRPWLVALVIAAGVALHLPSLGWGLFVEDWWQREALVDSGHAGTLRPWNLYDHGTAESAQYAQGSTLPWWTDGGFRARAFEPLPSVVLWLEHAVLGSATRARHALGLAWHALFLVLAWRLYRAAGLGPGTALLALGILAAHDGSALVVGQIARRDALLEGVATAGALLAALAARRGGEARATLTALGLCAALLATRSSGVVACALVAALLWGRGERVTRRASACVVLLAVVAVLARALAGAGYSSPLLPTPLDGGGLWLSRLLALATVGVAGTLGPLSLEALWLRPDLAWPLVLGSLAVLLPLTGRTLRALGALGDGRWLVLFGVLALLPVAGALPGDRLMHLPLLGLAPLAAAVLVRGFGHADPAGRWGRRGLAAVFACAVPLSAVLLVGRGELVGLLAADVRRATSLLDLDERPEEHVDVFVLQSPSALVTLGLESAWRLRTGDRRTRFHALQLGGRDLRWSRPDEHTFELETTAVPFVEGPLEPLFLDGEGADGLVARTEAYRAETWRGRPVWKVRLRTPRQLESDRTVFLTWRDGAWRRCVPPPVGETLRLRATRPLLPGFP